MDTDGGEIQAHDPGSDQQKNGVGGRARDDGGEEKLEKLQ